MAKVSIIVPVYKVEQYLEKCVDSLREQTLSDIEIILVDDGSPDRCPEICDNYARIDKRIKVIHKQNGGLGLARNSGIEIATGEFIAFLDSDDYVDKEIYQCLYDHATKNNLDICYCDVINFDYKDNRVLYPRTKPATIYEGKDEVFLFSSYILAASKSDDSRVFYPNMSWNAIYKGVIIRNNEIRFKSERVYVSEDVLFHLESLIYFKKIGWFDAPLVYHYMSNANSLTNTIRPQKIQAALNMIKIVIDESRELYPNFSAMDEAAASYIIKLINDISISIASLILNPFKRFSFLKEFLIGAYNIVSEPISFIDGIHKSKTNVALNKWAYGKLIQSILYYNSSCLIKRIKLATKKILHINQN